MTTLKVKIPHHHLRCRRICTQHRSSLPKWKRRCSSRSEIPSSWPSTLISAKHWRCPVRPQWRPGGLDGIYRWWSIICPIKVRMIPYSKQSVLNWLLPFESPTDLGPMASVAIATQHIMVLDASAFWDCRATLLTCHLCWYLVLRGTFSVLHWGSHA